MRGRMIRNTPAASLFPTSDAGKKPSKPHIIGRPNGAQPAQIRAEAKIGRIRKGQVAWVSGTDVERYVDNGGFVLLVSPEAHVAAQQAARQAEAERLAAIPKPDPIEEPEVQPQVEGSTPPPVRSTGPVFGFDVAPTDLASIEHAEPPDVEPDPDFPGAELPPKPTEDAVKAEWVEWGRAHGYHIPNRMTKIDIIVKYGRTHPD